MNSRGLYPFPMGKTFFGLNCMIPAILISLSSCKTVDKLNEQCPNDYNHSVPHILSIRANVGDGTQLLQPGHKDLLRGISKLSSHKPSLKVKREIPDESGHMKCPTVTEITRAKERNYVFLPHFQEPLTTIDPIIIQNQSNCLHESVRNISSTSKLSVVISSCCESNCFHEITLRTKSGNDILLNFTDFTVPDLTLISDGFSRTCQEYLDLGVTTEEGRFHSFGRYCGYREPGVQYFQKKEIKLRLHFSESSLCMDDISFTVTVSPCVGYQDNDCSDMRLNKLNDNEGFITSPGLDVDAYYPNNINCSVQIKVPNDKLIELQLKLFEVGDGDFIYLIPYYSNNGSLPQFPEIITYSGTITRPSKLVLPSNECTLQFISDDTGFNVGFNLTYVAVDKDEFIPMFPNKSLDCSGLHKIPDDIQCDFHKTCARGEDESVCPYRFSQCTDHSYHYNGSCYHVRQPQRNFTWMDAVDSCAQLKSQLVSINTIGEAEFLHKLWEKYAIKSMFLGLRRVIRGELPQMYSHLWRWSSGQIALFLPNEFRRGSWDLCSLSKGTYFQSIPCHEPIENVSIICEETKVDFKAIVPKVVKNISQEVRPRDSFLCSSGEYISNDLLCDGVEHCFDRSDEIKCQQLEGTEKRFRCQSGQLVRYSYVCNGIKDCNDNSDEDFCEHLMDDGFFHDKSICPNGMRIRQQQWCDGREDCYDGTDEKDCLQCNGDTTFCPRFYCFPKSWEDDSEVDCPLGNLQDTQMSRNPFEEYIHHNEKPPGIVYPDGYGKVKIEPLTELDECPETHFQCHEGFCIPIYMLCNNYVDCPYGEDEDNEVCEAECRGLYKCKYTSTCVHQEHICDNVYNCPYKDDENMCSVETYKCPPECSCSKSEVSCNESPAAGGIIPASYISISADELDQPFLATIDEHRLIYLNISGCSLETFNYPTIYMNFHNLLIIDASNSKIKYLPENIFQTCQSLKEIYLAENKLEGLGTFTFLKYTSELKVLDLSYNRNIELADGCFWNINKLQNLYLRHMGIRIINRDTFKGLVSLRTLDLKGNAITKFSQDIFKDLQNLDFVTTDNFQLCCDSVIPETLRYGECNAPLNEVSSCTDLLRSYFLRISLWIMATLTIVGNVSVMIWRIFFDDTQRKNFCIIITNLAGSDLMMGIYLVIIGIADASFRGQYYLHDEGWKSSIACKLAAYLCLLSTEVSALYILVATIDRLLVITFPLRQEFHLTIKSATIISILVWLIGLTLCTIPLLPPYEHWNLYSQRPMGIPLPITTQDYPGQDYTFGVLIVMNIIILILISVGQLIIYLSVTRRHRPQISQSRMKQDTALAKRLAMVVATDCLCWFPITIMGVLAQSGVQIPIDIHVIATVFVLPVNSALNPFLYTILAIYSKRKRMKKRATGSTNRTNSSSNQK